MTHDYQPAPDLLGHGAALAYQLELNLLGLPLRLRSNSPGVIAAAGRSFALWHDEPPDPAYVGPPLRVDIVVHQAADDPPTPAVAGRPRFSFRLHGGVFLAAAGANILSADMSAGRALGFVMPDLAANEPSLRYAVIECLALMLTAPRDRTPVHAAALVHGGRAALLVAPSGVGKSTLCYAAARSGLSILAEDAVYVALQGGLRLWGNPGRVHLLPDAPRLFPELAGREPAIQANGKLKLAVDLSALEARLERSFRGPALVCLLARATGRTSRLEPLPAVDALAALARPHEPGFDILADRGPAVARALAAGEAYRLFVGDPIGAAGLLRHLLEHGG